MHTIAKHSTTIVAECESSSVSVKQKTCLTPIGAFRKKNRHSETNTHTYINLQRQKYAILFLCTAMYINISIWPYICIAHCKSFFACSNSWCTVQDLGYDLQVLPALGFQTGLRLFFPSSRHRQQATGKLTSRLSGIGLWVWRLKGAALLLASAFSAPCFHKLVSGELLYRECVCVCVTPKTISVMLKLRKRLLSQSSLSLA